MGTSLAHSFTKNASYYTGTVYEWNLPTGTTCPYADECKVTVNRITGWFKINKGGRFKCYAASAERYPAVRHSRWQNYDYLKAGGVPILPPDCKALRIHAAGDFYSQQYFDLWLQLAADNPAVEMWAFTKLVRFWVARLGAQAVRKFCPAG